MKKSWVYRSDLVSVDNNKTSILAILETILAISITLCIWKLSNSFFHIYIGLIIAPFLLLRTSKSIEEGLKLFNRLSKFVDFKYNKIISYSYMSIFYLFFGYIIFNLQFFIIYCIFILCSILIFYLTDRNAIKENALYRIALIIELIPITLIPMILLILLSQAIKIFSTIKNFSFESIKAIPINWKKIIFETDIFYPPELLPGIEKCDLKNLDSFKSSNILIIKELNISIASKIYVILNFLLLVIPALIYRYSLKATALIYVPLIWLLPINNTISTLHMKENSKTLLSLMMVFYALFVIFILTIIPLYLHSQMTNLVESLPTFINHEVYKIFFAIEFNLWHITRFIASIITIYIFIYFQKRLLKIEENKNLNNDNYNFIIILEKIRKGLTFFTLICTMYLFYINSNIPEYFFNGFLNNFKFLPW